MDFVGIGEPEHGQRHASNDPKPPRRVEETRAGGGKHGELSEH
jgi:hypothetical protein